MLMSKFLLYFIIFLMNRNVKSLLITDINLINYFIICRKIMNKEYKNMVFAEENDAF